MGAVVGPGLAWAWAWAGLAAPAAAWTGVDAAWPEPPIPYQIADDLGGLDEVQAIAAIHAAFATWESVDCTSVRFAYQGRAAAPLLAVDGVNSVAIVSTGWPGTEPAPSTTRLSLDGTAIVEADIAIDAQDASWALEGADGISVLDLQAGLVAEVGHLLGLADSDVADATMNPALRGSPDGRTLSDDDILGVCTLYPAELPGKGRLGAPCTSDETCVDGFVCVVDAASSYCAPTCPGDECPGGYTCLGFTGSPVCVRGGCGCALGTVPGPLSGGSSLAAGVAAVLLARSVSRARRQR